LKFGVVVFPGSNCDQDCFYALNNVLEVPVNYIWHRNQNLEDYDCIVLPGGFSYGDYLRPGAIARFSPVIESVVNYVEKGGLVLGICNGFQILLEAGLLPGAMIKNESLKFVCRDIYLRVESTESPFTEDCEEGEILSMPVAHKDGNYFIDEENLIKLKERDQIVLRYVSSDGTENETGNPNGAIDNIAAITNRQRNVLGMMPHPERSVEKLLGSGSEDGLKLLLSAVSFIKERG